MHRSEPGQLGPPATGKALKRTTRNALAERGAAAQAATDLSTSVVESAEPRAVCVTVWRRVDVSVAEAFDGVVPIDLTRIFRGYGPLPAVIGASEAPGGERWGREGQSRSVEMRDGGRMEETVLEVQHPGLFRYRVVPVAGPLRLAVRSVEGRFVFARSEHGGTVIRWTYAFQPRRGARPVVRLLAPLWRRYANQVMGHIADEFAA